MSVLLCSNRVIDSVIGLIVAPRNGMHILTCMLPSEQVFLDAGFRYDGSNYDSENKLGQMMLELNYESYRARYCCLKKQNDAELEEFRTTISNYKFDPTSLRGLALSERAKACCGYMQLSFWKYQSCEAPNAENTAIWKALENFEKHLTSAIISSLPESQDIWG